ncbi:uncharacterized protein LOC141632764 [Silene latifolia]|uniref:uncharacterized protein LOC141632764 n=1 Tax=Silene latifolia TaxID=37657 RepID=UPI003D777482
MVTEKATSDEFFFFVVYGFNEDSERSDLWAHMKFIKDNYHKPWGVYGDFNNVLHYNERIGREVTWSEIAEFRACVQWTCTLILFLISYLKQAWTCPVRGTFMYQLVLKLRNLKQNLRELNRSKFSDVDKSVGVSKALWESLQIQLNANPTDESISFAEKEAPDSYRHLSKIQHSFLSQKAKVDWLSNGDDNTRFFHNHIRSRQIHNRVMCIKGDDGILYHNPKDIEVAFLNYNKSLLGTCHSNVDVHVPTVRAENLVTLAHNNLLLVDVTDEEIKGCLFSIAGVLAGFS